MMTKEKVRNFVLENFMFGSSDGNFSDDTSLVSTGIMDSTGVMEMIGFLEDEFKITMDDQDLVPENLDSVNNVVAYLASKGITDFNA